MVTQDQEGPYRNVKDSTGPYKTNQKRPNRTVQNHRGQKEPFLREPYQTITVRAKSRLRDTMYHAEVILVFWTFLDTEKMSGRCALLRITKFHIFSGSMLPQYMALSVSFVSFVSSFVKKKI